MNRSRPNFWLPLLAAGLLVPAAVVGCMPTRRAVPFDPPNARPLAPTDDPCTCLTPGTTGDIVAADSCPIRRPREVLALSSGGVYGAFSAGVMAGWTKTGTRPEFDVVTGVSTGALIAPFAFLGPAYDCQAGRLYAGAKTEDIYKARAWVTIPWRDAVASSAPFRRKIAEQVTPDLMGKLAAEHKKGRRLYVGTTNLDTRRFVIWDIGAMACRPSPDSCRLVQDVLLASASVPGVLPPVAIEVEVDGKKFTEMHCDGGAVSPLFVPGSVFTAAAAGAAADAREGKPAAGGGVYAVVAGKLYPDAGPVRPRVLPVLGATAGSLLYSITRSELANMYALSAAAGLPFHLAALRQDFRTVDAALQFNTKAQTDLLGEGVRVGAAGPAWLPGPPELMPGDGDFVRTGTKLRSAPVTAGPQPPAPAPIVPAGK